MKKQLLDLGKALLSLGIFLYALFEIPWYQLPRIVRPVSLIVAGLIIVVIGLFMRKGDLGKRAEALKLSVVVLLALSLAAIFSYVPSLVGRPVGLYPMGGSSYTNITLAEVEGINKASLSVRTISSSIIVREWSGQSIKVMYNVPGGSAELVKRNIKVRKSLSNGILNLEVDASEVDKYRSDWFFLGPFSAYLEIQVPGNVNMSSLEIETVSGEVSIKRASIDRLSILSTSGDVQIDGNIKRVEAVSTSGDLYVDISTVQINMRTVSGDIESSLRFIGSGSVVASSTSGNIEANLEDSKVGYKVGARTVSGKVNVYGLDITTFQDNYIEARSKEFDSKELKVSVDIETVSGNIKVRASG